MVYMSSSPSTIMQDIRYAENPVEFPESMAFEVPQHPVSERQVVALQTWGSTSERSEEGVRLNRALDVVGRRDRSQYRKAEE